MLESGAGILQGVEGQRRLVLREAETVGEFRVLFLQVAGVGQENRTQIARRARAVNGSSEAALDQQRQIAAVVEMGMGENDGIDAARFDRKRRPVLEAQRLEALKTGRSPRAAYAFRAPPNISIRSPYRRRQGRRG